jgi:hypothetical protein
MEDLNTPSDGKSVNAIRFFTGEGVLVWGARYVEWSFAGLEIYKRQENGDYVGRVDQNAVKALFLSRMLPVPG